MISIIIPAYNAEKYIIRCLKSCINQSYRNIEVIVVDDGSTDETVKKCRIIKDSRIKIISKKNAGVSEARNTGIQVAKGEYIFFLDADDYLEKDCCANMVSAMIKDIDLVVCGYARSDINNSKQLFCSSETMLFDLSEKASAIQYIKEINGLFTCWNKLYRKEKIQFQFPKNMSFAEDSVFVFDYIAQARKIIVLNYVGYNYWIGTEGSAMKRFHADMFRMIQKEYDKIIYCGTKSEDPEKMMIFALTHYIENILYWCVPQLMLDKKYNFFQKRKLISQIWEINYFDDLIMKYRPQRKLHYIYRFLMKNKCSFVLTLLFAVTK